MPKAKLLAPPSCHAGRQPKVPRGGPREDAVIEEEGVMQSEVGQQPERESPVLNGLECSHRVGLPKR